MAIFSSQSCCCIPLASLSPLVCAVHDGDGGFLTITVYHPPAVRLQRCRSSLLTNGRRFAALSRCAIPATRKSPGCTSMYTRSPLRGSPTILRFHGIAAAQVVQLGTEYTHQGYATPISLIV